MSDTEQQAVPVAQGVLERLRRMISPDGRLTFAASEFKNIGAVERETVNMAIDYFASLPCKSGEGAGEVRWLPIETAPKDGSTFFARGRNWGRASNPYHVVQAQWSIDAGEWKDANDDSLSMAYIVEWYRLPDATQTREAEGVSVDDALAFADQIAEQHRQRANDAEARIKAAIDCMIQPGEGWQEYSLRLRATLSPTSPKPGEAELRQAFRNAARGYGRAGTADLPGGPDMSMDDAAEVYARLSLLDAELREAAQEAHGTLHECTAVLSVSDCKKVAAVMARLSAALNARGGA